MGFKVGIDLGTTYSAVAAIDSETGLPAVVKNDWGKSATPSVLYFEQDGSILFGESAKDLLQLGDGCGASLFKRSMGKEGYSINIHRKNYSATDFSAILLEKLIGAAEARLGDKIDSAVITVPAYFAHKEREATILAGRKAGLGSVSLISEPSSAVLAYGLNTTGVGQTVLVYDLGGGTFDVTIAKIHSDGIEILATDGDHQLGGKDWDDQIANHIARVVRKSHEIDLIADQSFTAQLLSMAEDAKRQLSVSDAAIFRLRHKGIGENLEISNATFERITQSLMDLTKELTEKAIGAAKLSWGDIDGVILVGGSTRMKMVGAFVQKMSGREPLSGVNVDEAVALGAAIKANMPLDGSAPHSRQTGPTGFAKIRITDVTAHSLGMIAESEDRSKYINDIIIHRNSAIPAESKKAYEAHADEMEVYVLQGESPHPLDNNLLHKYVIGGINLAPKGCAEISVTYRYDANSVVEVLAEQVESGRPRTLSVAREPIPEDMSWVLGSPNAGGGGLSRPNFLEIVLAVDLSGSMSGRPLRDAKKAILDFTKKFDKKHVCIGLLGFADHCEECCGITDDFPAVRRAIENLDDAAVGFGTSAEPFTEALGMFGRKSPREDSPDDTVLATSPHPQTAACGNGMVGGQGEGTAPDMAMWGEAEWRGEGESALEMTPRGVMRYIVCLTDGRWFHQEAAIEQAVKCHLMGIDVIALGFGGADLEFLRAIASRADFAEYADSSADLGRSFSRIGTAIGDGASDLRKN